MPLINKETRDIILSLAVLAVVFSYPEFLSSPVRLFVALFVLGIAFLGHELSHKYTARRFGFFAEYRMWPEGLMFALFLSFLTNGAFIFAAPGAVVFASYGFARPSKRNVGIIGLSGPVFNIALMLVFLLIPHPLFRFASRVNSWLAVFNLMPVSPLDGQKVFSWNPRIWAVSIGVAGGGLLLANII